jgi:hypothetical protein
MTDTQINKEFDDNTVNFHSVVTKQMKVAKAKNKLKSIFQQNKCTDCRANARLNYYNHFANSSRTYTGSSRSSDRSSTSTDESATSE